ncbi:MAG: HIT domain-containing protein [Candidatus Wildermuthbacteria bacterium]|nr:HIT domain-containing protein [Candidatus Wildermuthbacteria bacterium]
MLSRIASFLKFFLVLAAGVAIGAYLFSDSQPRSLLSLPDCDRVCFNPNEILGLLGSVGVQRASGALPAVVKETDRTIVIKHPFPQAPTHYVIVPKKDIKNIADMTEEDKEYVTDAMAVAGELVREKNLSKYRLYTNGSGYQSVAYLHFHLTSE